MFFNYVRPDDDIVYIYITYLPNEWQKCLSHTLLVYSKGVSSFHGYYYSLVHSKWCIDCSKENVIWVDKGLEE